MTITVQDLADELSLTTVALTAAQVAAAIRNTVGSPADALLAPSDEISEAAAEAVRAKIGEAMRVRMENERRARFPRKVSAALDRDVSEWMDEEAGRC